MRTKEEKMMMHLNYITLKRKNLVLIPVKNVLSFVEYCNERNIFPSGGSLSDDGRFQFIYR